MNRSEGNPGQGSRAGEDARNQLIQREMRFVLQQDVRRFTKQLLAHLLDEGCNLHQDLARIMFYKHFGRRLTSNISADTRPRFFEKSADSDTDWSHPRFHKSVKYFHAHLSDAEAQITVTVLDVIEALKLEWQRIAKKCLLNKSSGAPYLQDLIEQIGRVNPDGNLAQPGLDTIHRRLKIAIVTSLIRHVRKPAIFRGKYGSVPQILLGINRNPALLPALMATFNAQVPYAQHVIAQSFWRTLNNMDAELPKQPVSGSRGRDYTLIEP